jgi:CTP-dependent riboflavin kinase
VKRQFIEKLSIDPYPGTLNLEIVDPKSLKTFKYLKAKKGVEIAAEDPSFCSAQCYPILINGQLKGAIIFPLVEGYPENKMELIASENIKKALSVKAGDDLEVELIINKNQKLTNQ